MNIKKPTKSILLGAVTITLLGMTQHASAQNIYVANWFFPGPINIVTPGGSVSQFGSATTGEPEGLAFDSTGNLYVSDSYDNQIDKITPGGVETVFVTGLNNPDGIAFDASGNLYVADHGSGNIYKYTGTTRSTFASGIVDANELVFDGAGNLYVSGNFNNMITKITPGGSTSTFASGQLLDGANEMAFNTAGDMLVANGLGNTIVEITPGGTQSLFASGQNGAAGLAIDNSGNVYVGDQNVGELVRFSPDGSSSTVVANNLGNTTALAIQGVMLPVPEPATWALAAVGGAAFLLGRRRK